MLIGRDPNAPEQSGDPTLSRDEIEKMLFGEQTQTTQPAEAGLPGAHEPKTADGEGHGKEEPATPEAETPEPKAEETPEGEEDIFDFLFKDDIDSSADPAIDPETKALNAIAEAAGLTPEALKDYIAQQQFETQAEQILKDREQKYLEAEYGEDEVKERLALDRRALELHAVAEKYARIEAQQKLDAAVKEFPYADRSIVKMMVDADPKGDVRTFAKALHDRMKVVADRAATKYAAQKAKDGQGFTPDTTPSGQPGGVTKPAQVSRENSWLDIWQIGR